MGIAAQSANGILLFGVLDITAAEVRIVVRDPLHDIVDSDTVTAQGGGVELDGVLLGTGASERRVAD